MFCGHMAFFGHLAYFVVIGYIFLFWYVAPRKIWQPCLPVVRCHSRQLNYVTGKSIHM
jgi:hypothetical protein